VPESLVVSFPGLFFRSFAGFPEVEQYGKVFYGRLDRLV
jgi:hypothetical protein